MHPMHGRALDLLLFFAPVEEAPEAGETNPDGGVLGPPLAKAGQEPLNVVALDQGRLGRAALGLQVGHELPSRLPIGPQGGGAGTLLTEEFQLEAGPEAVPGRDRSSARYDLERSSHITLLPHRGLVIGRESAAP